MRALFLTLLPCSLLLGVGCGGRSTLDDFTGAIPGRPDYDVPSGGGGNDGPGSNGDGGVTDGGGAASSIGNACEGNEDCDGGTLCANGVELVGQMVELPGGYCTVTGCEQDDECGADGVQCATLLGASLCVRECEEDDDCRAEEGYACTTLPGADGDDRFCLPLGENDEPVDINPLCGLLCQEEDDQIECSEAFSEGGGFDSLPEGCGFGGGGGGDNPFGGGGGGNPFGGGGGGNPFGGGGGGGGSDSDIDPTCGFLCDEADQAECTEILDAGGGFSDLPDSCTGG